MSELFILLNWLLILGIIGLFIEHSPNSKLLKFLERIFKV